MARIFRLCMHLDKLVAKTSKAANARKRYSYRRAARRMRDRIQRLITEVHCQLAKFLACNYDVVMIPSFEVSQMVRRGNRVLNAKSVRQMACWSHYRFRQRLIHKCRLHGSKVVVVNESYTSKTCSSCGYLKHDLGSAKVFRCNACKNFIDLDINGAKNILLRNHKALGLQISVGSALGPTPSQLAEYTGSSSL